MDKPRINPPKIGIFVYGPLTRRSGGYDYNRALVDYLVKNHWDVVYGDLGPQPRNAFQSRVRYTSPLAPRLEAMVEDRDIIVVDGLSAPFIGQLKRHWKMKGRGIPLGALVHMVPTAAGARWIGGCDFALTTSEFLLSTVGALGLAKGSLLACPPAMDLEFPTTVQMNHSDELRVLSIGRIEEAKGQLTVARALVRGGIPHRYLVAGPDGGHLKKLVPLKSKGLNLEVLGPLSRAHLTDAIINCHVMALPSHEGYGMAMAEAMAGGRPVIGLDRGNAPQLIGSGGWLVPALLPGPKQVQWLSQLLAKLHHQRELLDLKGEEARARAQTFPRTWESAFEPLLPWLGQWVQKRFP